MMRRCWLVVGALAFGFLAILNCGGYRYGIGDQAFYIPTVLQYLDPSLFPRDRMLLHAQDGLTLFDNAAAASVRVSGFSIPALFLAAYLGGLALLFGAVVRLGQSWYSSWWTVSALVLTLTLRHRITQTGVNTLEGYLHPRMLVFALGVWALATFVRGGGLLALAMALAAGALHPTTGLWFTLWIGVALIVSEPRLRRPLLAAGLVGTAVAVWAVWKGPLSGRFVRMDSQWASLLAGKDYVFPSDWSWSFWLVNLAYLASILAAYWYRRLQKQAFTREAGVVCGAVALVGVFLLSWPLASAGVAMAIQLQVSRVFWMLDLLATVYLVWLAVEARPRLSPRMARRGLVVAIAVIAAVRGVYVMRVERADVPVVRLGLPRDEWTDVMAWAAGTPTSVHLLVDPGHAWKYGSSARVAGQRDVYLEEVKDVSIAMYSREVAIRVSQRIQDLGDFNQLTPEKARSLAIRYDLDYLITDRQIALPIAYRNPRFSVYALQDTTRPNNDQRDSIRLPEGPPPDPRHVDVGSRPRILAR